MPIWLTVPITNNNEGSFKTKLLSEQNFYLEFIVVSAKH